MGSRGSSYECYECETCGFTRGGLNDLTCACEQSWAVELRADRDRLRAQFDALRSIVSDQAEDAGLWFAGTTASEAYLQQELRRLHAAIEGGRG